mgnify:CR=1 FL=1
MLLLVGSKLWRRAVAGTGQGQLEKVAPVERQIVYLAPADYAIDD